MSIIDFFLDYKCSSIWVACLRILTSCYLMFALSVIIRDAWNFSKPYGGIYTGNDYLIYCKNNPQISLFNLFPNSNLFHVSSFIIFYLSGIMVAIGLYTQVSIFVFAVFAISIQSRISVIMISSADSVIRTMLMCLFLTDCGSALSLDILLGYRQPVESVDAWALRMFQVYMGMVYFSSAIPKLQDTYWRTGLVVRNSILSGVWGKRVFKRFFSKNSKLITQLSLAFEYLAPVGLLIQETNLFTIICGLLLHLSIAIFLRVGLFGPVMCIALLYCLDTNVIANIFSIE